MTATATVTDTIVAGRPELCIIRTYEVEYASFAGSMCVFADIQRPAGAKLRHHWGYDHASIIEVYQGDDGTVVADCQGMTAAGYPAEIHRLRFANLTSFEAWKTEVTYCDREDRFPGVNPHRRAWRRIDYRHNRQVLENQHSAAQYAEAARTATDPEKAERAQRSAEYHARSARIGAMGWDAVMRDD